jgi:hypothetical protein
MGEGQREGRGEGRGVQRVDRESHRHRVTEVQTMATIGTKIKLHGIVKGATWLRWQSPVGGLPEISYALCATYHFHSRASWAC